MRGESKENKSNMRKKRQKEFNAIMTMNAMAVCVNTAYITTEYDWGWKWVLAFFVAHLIYPTFGRWICLGFGIPVSIFSLFVAWQMAGDFGFGFIGYTVMTVLALTWGFGVTASGYEYNKKYW
jgi:hypothetical protein